jgi:hypothetical protein
MTRKGRAITLSLSAADKQSLENLALKFGHLWGDKPNISKLVQEIARRNLAIEPNHMWTRGELDALNGARKALTDVGQVEIALAIAELLLNRGEVEDIAIRGELDAFVKSQAVPWRREVMHFIERRQPFQLSTYVDATGQAWTFNICYAELVRHEGREYLDCWCDSTDGNQDLPELQHNWCFRLDRYRGSAIVSLNRSSWRVDFDRIDVTFDLLGRLAHSYAMSKHHVDDRHDACVWLDTQTYRVVRSVYNTYWLSRELRMHGEDCVIVAPESLQVRFRHELQATLKRYQTD